MFAVPQRDRPRATVLITGGTGGLGALVARHLVEATAPATCSWSAAAATRRRGAAELRRRARGRWAPRSRIAACDVADRDAARGAARLDRPTSTRSAPSSTPPASSTTATIEALDAERLERGLRPQGRRRLAPARADRGPRALRLRPLLLAGRPSSAAPARATTPPPTPSSTRSPSTARPKACPPPRSPGASGSARAAMTAQLGEADLARHAPRRHRARSADEQGLELFDAALCAGRRPGRRPAPRPRPLCAPRPRPASCRRSAAAWSQRPDAAAARRPAARLPPGSPSCPEAEREAVVARAGARRGRRGARPRLGRGDRARPGLQGAGLRLARRGRAAQPARRATGLRLPATVVFDYPTAGRPGRLPAGRGDAASGAARRSRSAPRPPRSRSRSSAWPAATPAGSPRPRSSGSCSPRAATAISEFPADRGWDLERLYDPDPDDAGHQLRARGRLPRRRRRFDAEFFGIAPREALAMDPQQRLLLEASWEALEDAGIDPRVAARQPDRRLRRGHVPGLRRRPRRPARARGLPADRQRRQRRLRPRRLRPRPRGPGDHRRHRLLLLAGGDAPRRAGAARRASARWRWPAG